MEMQGKLHLSVFWFQAIEHVDVDTWYRQTLNFYQ